MIDYIIVGYGIAGLSFAFKLIKEKKDFVIIDTPETNLNTALQLLVDAQLMLDKLEFFNLADRIGDIVGDLYGE